MWCSIYYIVISYSLQIRVYKKDDFLFFFAFHPLMLYGLFWKISNLMVMWMDLSMHDIFFLLYITLFSLLYIFSTKLYEQKCVYKMFLVLTPTLFDLNSVFISSLRVLVVLHKVAFQHQWMVLSKCRTRILHELPHIIRHNCTNRRIVSNNPSQSRFKTEKWKLKVSNLIILPTSSLQVQHHSNKL